MRYFYALCALSLIANALDEWRLDRKRKREYPDGRAHYRVAMSDRP